MAESHAEIRLPDNPRLNAASNWTVRPNGLSASPARQPQVICPVCGSGVVHRFSLPHTSVWECLASKCRLQFADPQLDDRNLNQAYKSLYYPLESNGSPIENTPESVLRQVFFQLQKCLGELAGLRLLDYGCGVGSLLRVAAEFATRPTGIESDAQARATAATVTGVPVYRNFEQLCAAERDTQFDIIVLWTVIEHLRRPWEDLARLRRLLSPAGSLLVSTINIRCLRARIQRHRWVQYRNPTHLYYFDPRSLARVIQKAGFKQFSQWHLRIRYPHHGLLRRSLHYASVAARLADGLFYLCRNSTFKAEEVTPPTVPTTALEPSDARQKWDRT
jgi:2-polyprenyl-3-methyl-5-hydroxy-6-metoxy-1,4-benzoquinol methylase